MSSSPLSGDPSNDPTDDQTGRFVRQPNGRVRPLSPHLQVWRFHMTMAGSILNRIAAGGLYFGILAVAAWVICAAFGPEAYAEFSEISSSPLGLLVWFLISLGGVYHLFAGIRHLVWDAGVGLSPKAATMLTWISMLVSIAVTLILWASLFASGKVSL